MTVAAIIGWIIEYHDQRSSSVPWIFQARLFELISIGVILAVGLQLINGISGQFSLGHAGFMAVGAYLGGYASKNYGALDTDVAGTEYQNVGQVFWYFIALLGLIAAIAIVLVIVVAVLRQSRRVASGLPPVLMLATLIWFTWDVSAAFERPAAPPQFVWTWLIQHLGTFYTGLLEAGMPAARHVSLWLPMPFRRPICMIVLLGWGGFFAAAAGLLVGLPTLRLRGDYLAIATLGFAQILIVVFTNSEAVGKSTGLQIAPWANRALRDPRGVSPASASLVDPKAHHVLPWIFAVTVLSIVAIWRIAYSPKGRLIRAVREDEVAAAAVGINATRHKVTAFIIGAFFAGVGGVLYIHTEAYALADATFGIDKSLLFVIMVTLGGLGSISGAILGAVVLGFLPFLFREMASAGGVPRTVQKVFENQLALFAATLVVMMLVRPRGLLGDRELWPKARRRGKSEGAAT